MKTMLEGCKDLELVEAEVKIMSGVKEENIEQINKLVEEIQ